MFPEGPEGQDRHQSSRERTAERHPHHGEGQQWLSSVDQGSSRRYLTQLVNNNRNHGTPNPRTTEARGQSFTIRSQANINMVRNGKFGVSRGLAPEN